LGESGAPSLLAGIAVELEAAFIKPLEYIMALDWLQRARDACHKTLGRNHPSTLTSVSNTAAVFIEQGEYIKALEWYQHALDGWEKTLGEDHPSTLLTIHNIGMVFFKRGEHDKALD
jgi:tetratricopeptide (TPR) repeat protein